MDQHYLLWKFYQSAYPFIACSIYGRGNYQKHAFMCLN
ncbi:hypothetical protein FH603_4397 [Spirosoma sp. LMG 31447]|uniref:Uncharacterized protein n=1 Tax=Spirosoma utsteinense TaxID=2585773 RepID=A0ABR6WBC5_9BACT|nr:hypothetical protein [Spirosoma utsteinense]